MNEYAMYRFRLPRAINGDYLPLTPVLIKSSGAIRSTAGSLKLCAGYVYEISYFLGATANEEGYIRLAPVIDHTQQEDYDVTAPATSSTGNMTSVAGGFLLDAVSCPHLLELRYEGTAAAELGGLLTVKAIDAVK